MSTARRLSNDDVKSIFDCLYNNIFPPERLRFQIVVVGSNGMKLSPPSYEFKDGIYVLLKPLKKVKGQPPKPSTPDDDPRIPSNLKSLIFRDNPPEICPWSLSGPQFPTPTAIQQRYCYPKGDPEYSSIKGGALWTAYKENGAEDFDWRILHVYYSTKRAGNKRPVPFATGSMSSSAKRSKLQITHPNMPKLETPQRPKIDSFGSSFDDSPLSFNMPVSPFKDSSLVSILSKTASIDTESEPVISPDRIFFDVQTEFEKAHANRQDESNNRIRGTKYRDKRRYNAANLSSHYNFHRGNNWYPGYPYWSPCFHPPPLYHSQSSDSSNPVQYQEHPSNAQYLPPSQFPTQETRKPLMFHKDENEVSKFLEELRHVHEQLREKIENLGTPDRNKCKDLLSVWGQKIAHDPMSCTRIGCCEKDSEDLKQYGTKTDSLAL